MTMEEDILVAESSEQSLYWNGYGYWLFDADGDGALVSDDEAFVWCVDNDRPGVVFVEFRERIQDMIWLKPYTLSEMQEIAEEHNADRYPHHKVSLKEIMKMKYPCGYEQH